MKKICLALSKCKRKMPVETPLYVTASIANQFRSMSNNNNALNLIKKEGIIYNHPTWPPLIKGRNYQPDLPL
jgi:hypothetical protein